MSSENLQGCGRGDALRDWVLGELAPAERSEMEAHVAQCAGCAQERARLQAATAALRILADQEPPQRIVFVTQQSEARAANGFLQGFWNSSARLGFAAAVVLAVGMMVSAGLKRPAASDAAITAAVTKAVQQVRAEDSEFVLALQRKMKTQVVTATYSEIRQ